MSDLKPCPFCGATNNKHRRNITELYDDDNYKFVKCHNCSSISYKWNSRPIEDALQARIEELEKQLANLRANSRTKLELDTCRSLNEALREENIRLIAENKKLKGDKDEATNLRNNQANQTRHP